MDGIYFNLRGWLFVAIGFGGPFAICWLLGVRSEEAVMMIAGPVTFAIDFGYRKRNSLWRGSHGGTLLIIPVWVLGVCWFLIGAAGLLSNHSATWYAPTT